MGILRILEEDGWVMVAQKGSHRQYKHLLNKDGLPLPGIRQMTLHPTWSDPPTIPSRILNVTDPLDLVRIFDSVNPMTV